jgi:hypothetical protein
MAIEDILKLVETSEFRREIEELWSMATRKKVYFNTLRKAFISLEDLFKSISGCDLGEILEKYSSTRRTIDSVADALERASGMTFVPEPEKKEVDRLITSLDRIAKLLDEEVKGVYNHICR